MVRDYSIYRSRPRKVKLFSTSDRLTSYTDRIPKHPCDDLHSFFGHWPTSRFGIFDWVPPLPPRVRWCVSWIHPSIYLSENCLNHLNSFQSESTANGSWLLKTSNVSGRKSAHTSNIWTADVRRIPIPTLETLDIRLNLGRLWPCTYNSANLMLTSSAIAKNTDIWTLTTDLLQTNYGQT